MDDLSYKFKEVWARPPQPFWDHPTEYSAIRVKGSESVFTCVSNDDVIGFSEGKEIHVDSFSCDANES